MKLSEVFPAHLQATWHLYRYWPHVLVSETLCDAMDCSPPGSSVCPWNSPGKNTGLFCHFLLQGIFPTQGLNLDLLHFWQILYCLSYQGSPYWSHRLLLVLKSIYAVRTLGFVGKCLPKPGVQSGPENAAVKPRPGAFWVFHLHF